jgi:hypothetical protein
MTFDYFLIFLIFVTTNTVRKSENNIYTQTIYIQTGEISLGSIGFEYAGGERRPGY